MGNQQQLRRDYNISEKIICKSGTQNIWDVYSGVHKETKQHVSIWICNTRQLKLKYKSDYTDFENRLKQETIFLSEFGANDVINNKYFLNIRKQFSNRNETIYITEPINGNMTSLKRELFTPLELQLKFSYLREALDKLHKLHGMVHNNVTKENIVVSASSLGTGHSSSKYFKLHGFYFFYKKGNPLNMNYRKRVKKRFKPSCLTSKTKDSINKEEFDMDCLRKIERDFFTEEEYSRNEKKIILLKQIIREKDKYESVKFMNDFLSDLNKENFEMDTFLNYIKDFLLLRIQHYEENKQIMDRLIHALMKYVPKLSDKQFSLLIFPKFKNALKYFQPRPIPLALIKYIELLLKFCTKDERRQFLYPFIETCLDQSDSSEVLIEILRKSEMCVNRKLIEKKYYIDKLLPKIIHLIRFTSFPFVKLNSIVCIGKIIHLINKEAVIENILPILKYSIRNEKSTLCLMTIVRVYNRVSKNLDIKTISHQILPNIIPASTYAKFDKEKFEEYFKVIKDLVLRIERERLKNFDELAKLKSAPPDAVMDSESRMARIPMPNSSSTSYSGGGHIDSVSGQPGQPKSFEFDENEDGFFDTPDPSKIREVLPDDDFYKIDRNEVPPSHSHHVEKKKVEEEFVIDHDFLRQNALQHASTNGNGGIRLPEPQKKLETPTSSDFGFINTKNINNSGNPSKKSKKNVHKRNKSRGGGVIGRDPSYDKKKLNLNLLDDEEDVFKMDEVMDSKTTSKNKMQKKIRIKDISQQKKIPSSSNSQTTSKKSNFFAVEDLSKPNKNVTGFKKTSKNKKDDFSEFYKEPANPKINLDAALDAINVSSDSIDSPRPKSTKSEKVVVPERRIAPKKVKQMKLKVQHDPPKHNSGTAEENRRVLEEPKSEEEQILSSMVKGIFGGYQEPTPLKKDEETLRFERERDAEMQHKDSMFEELMVDLDNNPLASRTPTGSLRNNKFYTNDDDDYSGDVWDRKKEEEIDPIKMMESDSGWGNSDSFGRDRKSKSSGGEKEEDEFEKLMMQHLDE